MKIMNSEDQGDNPTNSREREQVFSKTLIKSYLQHLKPENWTDLYILLRGKDHKPNYSPIGVKQKFADI